MQTSFFDLDNRYQSLSKSRDPLERLDKAIDWEIFRSTLEQVDIKKRKSKAGRKPTDRVRMFKMLLLQNKYNLSDEQLEYQAIDRLSFSRFIGVGLAGDVPDSRTIWAYRDALKAHGLMDKLFAQFDATLAAVGVQLNSGQIIDATFVPVPIQRNSRESNAKIKAAEVPEHWKDQPAKLRQKDVDARWTKKGGVAHYGYKNHVNIDKKTKLIARHSTTPANVHDNTELNTILRSPEEGGADVYADSAYRSEDNETDLANKKYTSHINERAYKNAPLTEAQEASNKVKSQTRARVEHVFGYQENSMGGIALRSIGLARAKVGNALKNLMYNLCRVEVLIRQKVFTFGRFATPKMGRVG